MEIGNSDLVVKSNCLSKRFITIPEDIGMKTAHASLIGAHKPVSFSQEALGLQELLNFF